MSDSQTTAIILAAGKSSRMKSATPKALHTIAGRPILGHVLDAAEQLGSETQPGQTVLVLAPAMNAVADYARSLVPNIEIALQERPRGTGDAVRAAYPAIHAAAEVVLILFGDTPLIRAETLKVMTNACRDEADVIVLGFEAQEPTGYGRLILHKDGTLKAIVEEKDASEKERAVTLCYGAAMAVRRPHLSGLLAELSDDNAGGEFYLTDFVTLANGQGLRCGVIECPEDEIMGINDRADLAIAEALMQDRLRLDALDGGVTLADPDTVYFSHDTVLGRDVTVGQHVIFGPGVTVGEGATIKPFSHLEGARVGEGAEIGPFARLRPGTEIGAGARVGNFVEIKKAHVEDGAKINHLSYIGDARVGEGANIGAGTITCNYDGFDKHVTDIGAGAFIGSNSSLVAPVKIGEGAYVGSGSVITEDVAPGALGLARGRQTAREGWAVRFRARHGKQKKGA